MVLDNLKFAESHEWVKLEGKMAIIGLSDYAVGQLGEIVFLELPSVDDYVTKGQPFATVESVKAASDVYSPVMGKVIEVNSELESSPEKVNQDCYGDGWICKIEIDGDLHDLMDSKQYSDIVEEIE